MSGGEGDGGVVQYDDANERRHNFDRRKVDVNYTSLHQRVAILERVVNEEVLPQLDKNTTMTSEIHAKNDEMYTAFVKARNGVQLITTLGNGAVAVAEWTAKKAKTFLILTFTFGALWTFFKTGKIPEWLDSFTKIFF